MSQKILRLDGKSIDFIRVFTILKIIRYFSLKETDWSIQMASEIEATPWECLNCNNSFAINGIQKLQHSKVCVPATPDVKETELDDQMDSTSNSADPRRSNTKKYHCKVCDKSLYLTSVEILKHRKNCMKPTSSNSGKH